MPPPCGQEDFDQAMKDKTEMLEASNKELRGKVQALEGRMDAMHTDVRMVKGSMLTFMKGRERR